MSTSDTEVEGSIVHIIHAEYDDTNSEFIRTVLALCTKDDLSVTVEEEDEDLVLATERRTRRYRTQNTVDLEVSSAIDVDMEAAELVGLVDSDGKLDFATESRTIGGGDVEEYIEIAYFDHENGDFADAELVHRFEECEATSPEIDPSETPPLLSWTWMVHGDVWLNHTESA